MNVQPQGRPGRSFLLLALCLSLAGAGRAHAASGNPNETYRFNIERGDAAYRLSDFSTQSGMQLLFAFESMKGIEITPVKGEMKPFEALDRMIRGTPIRYLYINKRTVTLTVEPDGPKGRVSVADARAPVVMDRRAPDSTVEEVTIRTRFEQPLAPTGPSVLSINRTAIDAIGAVTVPGVLRTLPQVFGGGPSEDTKQIGFEAQTNTGYGTGVNLRGLGAGSTLVLINGRRLAGGGSEGLFVDVSNLPLAAIERIDILPDSSSTFYGADGVGGVVNFVMRDRFDGVQSEAHYGATTRGGMNHSYISQVIGGETESSRGLFAIDFYSRDDLAAAERSLAKSDLTEFGGSNFDAPFSNPGTIVQGVRSWAIPRGQDGTALDASELEPGTQNLQNRYAGADILPSQQRWTAFASGRHDLTDRISLFSDVLYGERDVRHTGPGYAAPLRVPESNPFYVNPTGVPGPVTVRYNFLQDLGPQESTVLVRSADVAAGVTMQLGSHWRMTGTIGRTTERIGARFDNVVDTVALDHALAQSDPARAFNPFGDGSHTSPEVIESLRTTSTFNTRSQADLLSLTARGSLFALPGGDVILAAGAEAREQSFESALRASPAATPGVADLQRSIRSGFAELTLPLVGPKNRRRGIRSLELSVAQRYEHYSDFGNTVAPRLGLAWEPVEGFTIRGTYAESFRAPGLIDLDESRNVFLYVPQRNPDTEEFHNVLAWVGKNRDLRQESARSWTAGLQYEAQGGSGAALTYFNTRFTDRLSQPTLTLDLMTNPALASLITLNPTEEQRKEVCSRAPAAGSLDDCYSMPITAIADLRVRNDAAVHTQGIDAIGRYSKSTRLGRFTTTLNGTYIMNFSEARAGHLPLVDRVSTQNYPVDLRFRVSGSWQRSHFELFTYVNYLNSYEDVISIPSRGVKSWTTVDLLARYSIPAANDHWLGDTTLSLGVENLFDEDPPFLNNSVGIGYDQENGDLTGRVVTLTVRKKW